jgi:hypothetical protein
MSGRISAKQIPSSDVDASYIQATSPTKSLLMEPPPYAHNTKKTKGEEGAAKKVKVDLIHESSELDKMHSASNSSSSSSVVREAVPWTYQAKPTSSRPRGADQTLSESDGLKRKQARSSPQRECNVFDQAISLSLLN